MFLRHESLFGGKSQWTNRAMSVALRTKPSVWLIASLAVVMLHGEQSGAQGAATRPCASADLNGAFMLVDFQEIPSASFTTWLQQFPYHLMAFSPASTWSEMAYNSAPAAPAAMRGLASQVAGRSYALQNDGRLILRRGAAVQFAGSCSISLQSGNGFQENDLILSGNVTGIRSDVHELFRRWTGQPVAKAVSTFDPAPSAAADAAASASTAPGPEKPAEVQATMPEKPVPLRINVVTSSGPGNEISLVVTNENHAPLSAFMLVMRSKQTAERWMDTEVDACLQHRAPWQPGQQWSQNLGIPLAVGNLEVNLGAAIFTDGSTWGTPTRLAKLKTHRGDCQWPGL